jgi:HEAT repeat protein
VAGVLNRTVLSAKDETTLIEAASILAKLADRDTLTGLMNLLKSPYGEVKKHATWAIYRIGIVDNTRMIDDLMQIITSETEPLEVRINAVRAISLVKSPSEAVINTLETTVKMRGEKYSLLRYFAIQAMGRLRVYDEESMQTLTSIALREKDPLLKKEALRTVRKIGQNSTGIPEILASVFKRSDDPEVQVLVLEALGDMKSLLTAELAETLLDKGPNPEIKRRIIYAIASSGTEKGINLIITHAIDEDISELALALLQDLGGRIMKPIVERRLRSESNDEIVTILEELKTGYEAAF